MNGPTYVELREKADALILKHGRFPSCISLDAYKEYLGDEMVTKLHNFYLENPNAYVYADNGRHLLDQPLAFAAGVEYKRDVPSIEGPFESP